MNKKQTSKAVAKKASKFLRSKTASPAMKSVAGSAMSQARSKKKKKKG